MWAWERSARTTPISSSCAGAGARRARPRAEVLDGGAPGTHPALPLLARLALTSAQPQDFRLWPAEDGWRMESRDLDEEIAGEKGPLF